MNVECACDYEFATPLFHRDEPIDMTQDHPTWGKHSYRDNLARQQRYEAEWQFREAERVRRQQQEFLRQQQQDYNRANSAYTEQVNQRYAAALQAQMAQYQREMYMDGHKEFAAALEKAMKKEDR